MIELQVLSRIIKNQDISLLTLNGITEEYFISYPDEYKFIINHVAEFGNVPDKETFLHKFPEFTLVNVTESDRYLVETFNEENLYYRTVPIVNKLAEILQTDSREAVNFLHSKLNELQLNSSHTGVDIIAGADARLKEWQEKKNEPDKFLIPTGFPELDEILGGFSKGEELAVLFARTGNGKSWILIKMLEFAWRSGVIPGLIEPEMSPIKTGYRFDTLHKNISNTSLNRGEDIENYESYVAELKKTGKPFIVATPKDFRRKITVSKLRAFVKNNNIGILGIDGISYLTDERKERGDSRTVQLTNISEDLMDLSIELGIPVIVVCQSNRDGAKEENGPEIENIRDSDGIAYNASIIISGRQKGPGIELGVKKNRNGRTGDKVLYNWNIDVGEFEYVLNLEDDDDEQAVEHVKQKYGSGTEVF